MFRDIFTKLVNNDLVVREQVLRKLPALSSQDAPYLPLDTGEDTLPQRPSLDCDRRHLLDLKLDRFRRYCGVEWAISTFQDDFRKSELSPEKLL